MEGPADRPQYPAFWTHILCICAPPSLHDTHRKKILHSGRNQTNLLIDATSWDSFWETISLKLSTLKNLAN